MGRLCRDCDPRSDEVLDSLVTSEEFWLGCTECGSDDGEFWDIATYSIIRFHHVDSGYPERTLEQTGLSLEDAQAHCRREDTHGDLWFDGYESE